MCGIVGLLAKTESIENDLGKLIVPMFACMADRGPDSGGCAFFSNSLKADGRKFSLYTIDPAFDWHAWHRSLKEAIGVESRLEPLDNHAVLISTVEPAALQAWLHENSSTVQLLSVGQSIAIYKDEGNPTEIARRYKFDEMSASHCVGHTRMATESAVTPAHSHPFTAGEDFCLVHNGSLSNPYMLRRKLEREGLTFETDNDTEAACRYLQWRMQNGDDLHEALSGALADLDGFYTLLMATADRMCLVRDAFACKPAVVAETDDYVAISSEFRSVAHLPGIADANIFEPKPEDIYQWQV